MKNNSIIDVNERLFTNNDNLFHLDLSKNKLTKTDFVMNLPALCVIIIVFSMLYHQFYVDIRSVT